MFGIQVFGIQMVTVLICIWAFSSHLVSRGRKQKAVNFARVIDKDQLENPIPRFDSNVRKENAGVRMLNTVARFAARKFLRENWIDHETVRVKDVYLAVAGGHCQQGPVRRPT